MPVLTVTDILGPPESRKTLGPCRECGAERGPQDRIYSPLLGCHSCREKRKAKAVKLAAAQLLKPPQPPPKKEPPRLFADTQKSAPPPVVRPAPRPKRYEVRCAVCSRDFTAGKSNAQTCSDRCRKELYEMRHAPPKRLAKRGEDACSYCGAPATDKEHVTPRAHLKSMQDAGILLPRRIVPSCSECNGLASDNVYPSMAAKARAIGEMVEKRHAKLLNTPDWTEEELADLGYALRKSVEAMIARRDAVRARLAWNRHHFPPRARNAARTAENT